MPPIEQPDRKAFQAMQTAIIRPKQTAAMFGVSLSTVWNWNNPKHKQFRPDFPKPIKVSANATGWLQSELEGYLQKLADNRQGGADRI